MVPKDPSAETAQVGVVPAAAGGAFRAFISYSHRDTKTAEWLHKALETYRVPKPLIGRETVTGLIAARPGKVFRDRDELEVSADLSGKINEALTQSQFLIVLCSRASAASKWVNQEVINFKRLKGADRIIAVIVDGEPGAAAMPGRETEECFVPALRFKVSPAGELTREPAEPIAADLRPGKDTKTRVRLKVVAGLLGVGLDELIRRDSQRRARFLFYASVAMGCASLLLAYLTVDAIRSRNLAVASQANADRKRAQAEDLIEFLIGDVRTKLEPVGRLDVLDAVGQKALAYFSALKPEEQDDEALARRARALQLLGTIASARGSQPEAERLFQESRDTAKTLLERDRTSAQRLYEYGEALAQVATLLYKQGKYDDARKSGQEYLEVARQLNAAPDPPAAWKAQLARAWLGLGMTSSNLLDAKVALEQLETALALFTDLSQKDAENISFLKGAGSALEWIAATHYRAGAFDQAIEAGQRQVEVYDRALKLDPGNKVITKDQLIALRTLANIALNFGDSAVAVAKSEQALSIVTALTDLDPGNTDWKTDQAHILLDLGDGYLETKDLTKIDRYLTRSESLLRELSSSNPALLKWEIDLIRAAVMRGRFEMAADRPAAAARGLLLLQTKIKGLVEKSPNEPALRDRAALANRYLGEALKALGDTAGSREVLNAVLAAVPLNPAKFEMQAATTRAMALYHLGRYREAYPIMQRLNATGFRRRAFVDGWSETLAKIGENQSAPKSERR